MGLKAIVAATLGMMIPTAAMAAKVDLPENVTYRKGNMSGEYIDTVDFSYPVATRVDFGRLKLCVAENVAFDAVTLSDSSGSFVGPATGTYYQNTKSQTVQGGQVFKYVDDANASLIANGTADGGAFAWGLTRSVLRFELKAVTHENRTELTFGRIARATENSGSVANTGFTPVGSWKGAKPKQVYDALSDIAGAIKQCVAGT